MIKMNEIPKNIKSLHQITHNPDKNEGRAAYVRLNIYFTNFHDAEIFVKSKYYADEYGVMGMPGTKSDIKQVDPKTLIPNIYDNIEDFEENTKIKISLSKEERKKEYLKNMDKDVLIEKILKSNINIYHM